MQSAKEALQHFPADSQGNIDWVDALANGLIKPRSSVANTGQMQLRDDAIIMRNTLDSLAMSIHPRVAIVEGMVNIDDVMNTETGAPAAPTGS